MRLFIAINFSNEIKKRLAAAQDLLKKQAMKGNFTRPENLHLTLIFLGEITQDRLAAVKRSIDSIEGKAFELNTKGLGRFRRGGGDIWWTGIDGSPMLTRIYTTLADSLSDAGFEIEKRAFKPHLTLAREVFLKNDETMPGPVDSINIAVGKISLMKSERINGTLTYTEIYNKNL